MASVIPSPPPSHTRAGEQRLHAILAHLPEDVVVYHEPYHDGRVPDFVVIAPALGILAIEVRDWRAEKIHGGNHDQVHRDVDGHFKSVTHPHRQAQHYIHRLMEFTAKTRFAARFLHPGGIRQGQFRFPVARLTVLSNITTKSLAENHLAEIFPERHTATRDTLDHWETLYPDELLDVLRTYFDQPADTAPFDACQVDPLRAIIHPEIYIDRRVSLGTPDGSQPGASAPVKTLDIRQENAAGSLGSGHRIVYGVAGSGKTLLLIARARRLAGENPDARILLTCHNRSLAASLRQTLARFPSVAVASFGQLAGQYGASADGHGDTDPERRDTALGESLAAKLDTLDHDEKYDAVLVDEAQDFDPTWFTALLNLMKDPVDGDLLIVADASQGLYRRSKIAWSHLGINTRGKTPPIRLHLDRNYRNAAEIATLAESFAHASDQTGITTPDDQIQSVQTDRSAAQPPAGAPPLFIEARGRKAELDAAYQIAQGLLGGTWDGRIVDPLKPGDIAILYPDANVDEIPLLRDFVTGATGELAPVEWLSDPGNTRNRDRISTPAIKLQTIASSKGLQARAAVLVWADKLPGGDPLRRRADRRLLYVALTRPESYLAITASGRSQFVDDLAAHPAVESRPAPGEASLFSAASVA